MNRADLLRTLNDLLGLAVPVLVLAAVSGFILFFLLRKRGTPVGKEEGSLAAAFAVLGGICGVIAGASSEPLVGALITGVLGLVSGLLSYSFASKPDQALRGALAAIVILLMTNALFGLAVGQNWKRKWDDYETRLSEYRTEYSEIWTPVTKLYQTEVMRRCVTENKSYEQVRANCTYEKLFPAK